MTELDPRLQDVVRVLRRLPRTDPAALHQLGRAVRGTERPKQGWLMLSPLNAVLAVAMIALITSGVWYMATRGQFGTNDRTPVQFVFVDKQAASVTLAGDFNDWDRQATPLQRSAGGMWSVVVDLPPGTMTYSFIINGEIWVADPSAPVIGQQFGRPSSTVYVSAGGGAT
jgi:hypothetical protein